MAAGGAVKLSTSQWLLIASLAVGAAGVAIAFLNLQREARNYTAGTTAAGTTGTAKDAGTTPTQGTYGETSDKVIMIN